MPGEPEEKTREEKYDSAIRRLQAAYYEYLAAKKELLTCELGLLAEGNRVKRISKREEEILGLIKIGLGNKEIGSRLNICERTVKFHVGSLLNKFGVHSRHDLP